MKTETIVAVSDAYRGLFQTFTFVKANGDVRVLNGRTGVKRYLKNGKSSYEGKEGEYIVIYDLKNKGYRAIKAERILSLRVGGKDYIRD